MSSIIESMLEKYQCKTQPEYEHAIYETIQEIALLGLWRSKFFEHAAFYGGTALRILYGLNRFSEDLDFSLLKPNPAFDLSDYNTAIKIELNSFGFTTEVETKIKSNTNTSIQSAFIKANTRQQFINIHVDHKMIQQIHKDKTIKIKMELDIDPPLHFETETKPLLEPIAFNVNSYTLPCLFAGKLHALLCRAWKNRVKGRDWYDFAWYLGRKIKPDLTHLQARLIQSGNWSPDKKLEGHDLKELLLKRIQEIDFDQAKEDVLPFITDPMSLDVWSKGFFTKITEQFLVIE